MMLDHNVTFKLDSPIKIYWDIETTCSDGVYRGIPKPNVKEHKTTMIQFLIDKKGEKLQQYIYHLSGYEYDINQVKQQFKFKEPRP